MVGFSTTAGNAADHAFRWTAATGTKDLNTLLANAGVNMSGITLFNAVAISANGQFITGDGTFDGGATNHAYLVRYDDGAGGVIAGITTAARPSSNRSTICRTRARASWRKSLASPCRCSATTSPSRVGTKPVCSATADRLVGVATCALHQATVWRCSLALIRSSAMP